MLNNEEIVRELYAAAEGSGKDIAKLVSFFSDEGYIKAFPHALPIDLKSREVRSRWPIAEQILNRRSLPRRFGFLPHGQHLEAQAAN